jgi:hypothetical protein
VIYDDIVEYPHSLAELAHVLDADLIDELQRARPEIVSDIRASLERVRAADDSTAITLRNFLIASRGLHAIGLQGVLCREHVEVYYPFTNDVQLLSTLLQLPPTRLAYRRFYIELFRRRYPKFAALPVDSSGLPLRRGPLAHKWAVLLRGMGIAIPGLRSVVSAQHVPPVHWGAWLQQSETLRQALAGFFAESPLVNRSKLDSLLTGLARGDELGGGKLPQIAAISRWYAIAAHVGSMQGV